MADHNSTRPAVILGVHNAPSGDVVVHPMHEGESAGRRGIVVLGAWSAVLTALAMPIYSFYLPPGLDQSFQSALHLLSTTGARFGSDVVFTFGPLGFLAFPQLYYPTTSLLATLMLIGVVFGAAWVSLWCFRRAASPLAAIVLAYGVMVLGWNRLLEIDWLPEAAACLVTVVCLLIVSRYVDQRTPFISVDAAAALFGSLSGMFLLIKVTTGMQMAGVSVLTLWIVSSPTVRPTRRAVRTLAIWLATFVISGLAIWLASGQRLGDIPSFISYSGELVGGYAGAMGTERPATVVEYPAAALLIVSLARLLTARWGLDRLRANPVLVLPAALYVFTAFKHGFVRHDRHSMVFFITVGLLALALLSDKTFKAALIALGIGLATAMTVAGFSVATLNPLSHLAHSADVAALVVDTSHRRSEIDDARARTRRQVALSEETVALLEGRRVHADPWDADVLWAYPEFEWGAPPVFQTFAAFTRDLDRLNADLLRSDEAPDYILRRVDSIDGRHPSFESPAYMVEMACRYQELVVDGSWTVLERTTSTCGPTEAVSRSTVALGERVSLPHASQCDGWMVLTVDGLDTSVQSLQTLLFKDATYWLTLQSGERYRLIPRTARQPHLLPGEDSPAWLGSPLANPQSALGIERTGFTALARETFELTFNCLTTR